MRENAARIYAAYSLDGRKLSDGMLVAALRMMQDASDENVTVPRLEAALLAAEIIANAYSDSHDDATDMAPTLVTELVALSRRSEIHTSRAAGFVVCRAISRVLGVGSSNPRRDVALMFSRSGGEVVLTMLREKVFAQINGCYASEESGDRRSVGATAEDDAHTRIIYLALTDEITAILNLVSSGSGDALSTAESQVKRVSRPKSIKITGPGPVLRQLSGDIGPTTSEDLRVISIGSRASKSSRSSVRLSTGYSPLDLRRISISSFQDAGSTPRTPRVASIDSLCSRNSSLDERRANAVELTKKSPANSWVARALEAHESMRILQTSLCDLTAQLEGPVLDQCERISGSMSVDALSVHKEVDKLLRDLAFATRKAEGVRTLVDEWMDAEMFYLRTLYSTLSTSNPEELKSERAHVCNETMSEAEAKLEIFENACMHPLSDAEDVQVRTNNGQRLLSVRYNDGGGDIPSPQLIGRGMICGADFSLASFTRFDATWVTRTFTPSWRWLDHWLSQAARVSAGQNATPWIHHGASAVAGEGTHFGKSAKNLFPKVHLEASDAQGAPVVQVSRERFWGSTAQARCASLC